MLRKSNKSKSLTNGGQHPPSVLGCSLLLSRPSCVQKGNPIPGLLVTWSSNMQAGSVGLSPTSGVQPLCSGVRTMQAPLAASGCNSCPRPVLRMTYAKWKGVKPFGKGSSSCGYPPLHSSPHRAPTSASKGDRKAGILMESTTVS